MVTIRNDLTLVMCSWNRPWYIYPVLEAFSKQTVKCPFIIWNNNQQLNDKLKTIVDRAEQTLGIDNITIYNNAENVGGFGRFYASRDLVSTDYVMFIDDDWEMHPECIEKLASNCTAKTIRGLWCWKYSSPSERGRIISGPCDYIGTCGMVAPRALFDQPGIYNDIPKKYWFIEDIWLCFFAKHELGYNIESCGKLEKFARNMNRDKHGNLIEKVPGLANKMWNLKPEFVKFLMHKYGAKNV
jgi:hypothetical protein